MLYITPERDVMSAGALVWSQVDRIVYAAGDEKHGVSNISKNIFHSKTVIEGEPLEKEASEMFKTFFERK